MHGIDHGGVIMGDWVIETSDALDHVLAARGIPDAARMRAVADIMTALQHARRAKQRADADAEAARLLPLGADVVAIRQQCHRATAYRRALRAKVVAPIPHSATNR